MKVGELAKFDAAKHLRGKGGKFALAAAAGATAYIGAKALERHKNHQELNAFLTEQGGNSYTEPLTIGSALRQPAELVDHAKDIVSGNTRIGGKPTGKQLRRQFGRDSFMGRERAIVLDREGTVVQSIKGKATSVGRNRRQSIEMVDLLTTGRARRIYHNHPLQGDPSGADAHVAHVYGRIARHSGQPEPVQYVYSFGRRPDGKTALQLYRFDAGPLRRYDRAPVSVQNRVRGRSVNWTRAVKNGSNYRFSESFEKLAKGSAVAFQEDQHPRGDHGHFAAKWDAEVARGARFGIKPTVHERPDGSAWEHMGPYAREHRPKPADTGPLVAHPLNLAEHRRRRDARLQSLDNQATAILRAAPPPAPEPPQPLLHGEGRPVFHEKRSGVSGTKAWRIGAKTPELPIAYTGSKALEQPVGSFKVAQLDFHPRPEDVSQEAHAALHHGLRQSIEAMREPTIAAGMTPKKRGKQRGQVLIPEGTERRSVHRAYNHAAMLAMHQYGIGHYNFAMSDEVKAELTPLVGFMRYAKRNVSNHMWATQKGHWKPYRAAHGIPFGDQRRDRTTGEVRLRVPPQHELIKAAATGAESSQVAPMAAASGAAAGLTGYTLARGMTAPPAVASRAKSSLRQTMRSGLHAARMGDMEAHVRQAHAAGAAAADGAVRAGSGAKAQSSAYQAAFSKLLATTPVGSARSATLRSAALRPGSAKQALRAGAALSHAGRVGRVALGAAALGAGLGAIGSATGLLKGATSNDLGKFDEAKVHRASSGEFTSAGGEDAAAADTSKWTDRHPYLTGAAAGVGAWPAGGAAKDVVSLARGTPGRFRVGAVEGHLARLPRKSVPRATVDRDLAVQQWKSGMSGSLLNGGQGIGTRMNRFVAGAGGGSDKFAAQVHHLTSTRHGFDTADETPKKLWRGTSGEGSQAMLRAKVGDVVTNHVPTSWTTSRRIASGFAAQANLGTPFQQTAKADRNTKVRTVIRNPHALPNMAAIDKLNPTSLLDHLSEREVLLGGGTKLRVDRIKDSKHGRVVLATALHQDPKASFRRGVAARLKDPVFHAGRGWRGVWGGALLTGPAAWATHTLWGNQVKSQQAGALGKAASYGGSTGYAAPAAPRAPSAPKADNEARDLVQPAQIAGGALGASLAAGAAGAAAKKPIANAAGVVGRRAAAGFRMQAARSGAMHNTVTAGIVRSQSKLAGHFSRLGTKGLLGAGVGIAAGLAGDYVGDLAARRATGKTGAQDEYRHASTVGMATGMLGMAAGHKAVASRLWRPLRYKGVRRGVAGLAAAVIGSVAAEAGGNLIDEKTHATDMLAGVNRRTVGRFAQQGAQHVAQSGARGVR